MRYNVCLFSRESNMMYPEISEEFTSIKKAKEEYFDLIREGFHGETVIAYKLTGNYDNIMPQITLRKKTDWRYGADFETNFISDPEIKNRNKFLKFQYLGKTL